VRLKQLFASDAEQDLIETSDYPVDVIHEEAEEPSSDFDKKGQTVKMSLL